VLSSVRQAVLSWLVALTQAEAGQGHEVLSDAQAERVWDVTTDDTQAEPWLCMLSSVEQAVLS